GNPVQIEVTDDRRRVDRALRPGPLGGRLPRTRRRIADDHVAGAGVVDLAARVGQLDVAVLVEAVGDAVAVGVGEGLVDVAVAVVVDAVALFLVHGVGGVDLGVVVAVVVVVRVFALVDAVVRAGPGKQDGKQQRAGHQRVLLRRQSRPRANGSRAGTV